MALQDPKEKTKKKSEEETSDVKPVNPEKRGINEDEQNKRTNAPNEGAENYK